MAGNSGGVGPDQTDSFSEAVRNDDGTCSGWDGPGGGAWTDGLVVGAPVRILDRETDEEIGTGSVVSASFTDVDPGDREQWVCNFAFTATDPEAHQPSSSSPSPISAPWVARPDPTRPGEFIASVNTVADPSFFSQCTDDDFGEEVTEWSAAGLFWSNGISSVCSNGLHIEALDRPCRPPDIGSDHVISVVRADDPSVVLEDTSGLLVDPATLEPGTPVIVRIATGRPCG